VKYSAWILTDARTRVPEIQMIFPSKRAAEDAGRGRTDGRRRLEAVPYPHQSKFNQSCMAIIDTLKTFSSDTVTIHGTDPGKDTVVECRGVWTGLKVRRFVGVDLLQALEAAGAAFAKGN
jgi:hypothetical protein